MKLILNSLVVIGVLITFKKLSCRENNDKSASIFGKWNIKIDTSFVGQGASNHEVIYSGKSGDYFNFNSDGHIYIRENSILDTLTYTISSDSVLIKNFSPPYEGKCMLESVSTHNIVISSGYFFTYQYHGQTFGRTIYLYR